MAVTININGLSLVHQGSDAVATATLPDVCKTPAPPGPPVPTPYVNVARSSSLVGGTKHVLVDGGNPAAVLGSEFALSNGDEAGAVGGVKSGTLMGKATWLTYSFNVRFEGRNVCRLTDKMMMNNGNTACLAGVVQAPVVGPKGAAALHSPVEEELEGQVVIRLAIDPRRVPGFKARFVLFSGDGSYKQARTIEDDRVPGDKFVDLLFTGLKTRSRYSLQVESEEREPHTLFERVPFASLSSLTRPAGEEVEADEPPSTRRCRGAEYVVIDEE